MTVTLTCLQCGHTLVQLQDHLHCPNCEEKWPLTNGIPRFFDAPYYWGEIPQFQMDEVNRQAKKVGWREVVNSQIKPTWPRLYQYIVSDARADFIYLTNISSNSDVLDIGSGWGAISTTVAKKCRHLVAVESVPERVEFLRIRAEQENINNIQQIQTTFLDLPFPNNSFDLIILSGVVEWVGISSDEASPVELQRRFLQKVNTLLKPGGSVYIGIENRFGYPYFLGANDHTGMRFTSLVPRFVADVVMQLANRDYRVQQKTMGYRTYTYSYWGYKRILKKTGFDEIRIYGVFPDYNHPSYIIPLEGSREFKYSLSQIYSGDSRRRQILRALGYFGAPAGLHRIFTPHFSIYAKKMKGNTT